MYDKPGTIYLYTMHTHLILNMVTQEQGKPQGVMIRAIEPVEGVDKMIENRQGRQGVELTNGPGKLVAALGIDKQLYGQSIFLVRYGSCQKTKIPEKLRHYHELEFPIKVVGPSCL